MLQGTKQPEVGGGRGVHLGVFLCEYLAKIKPISIKLLCLH